MRERRRFPRYDVANLTTLTGQLQQDRKESNLVIMGAGGCGFFSSPTEEMLKDKSEVHCTFSCPPVLPAPVMVKGTVAYSQLVTMEKTKQVYYGIEFFPDEAARVAPLIKYLEDLAATGHIKVSA
jgi:hypothetical protein